MTTLLPHLNYSICVFSLSFLRFILRYQHDFTFELIMTYPRKPKLINWSFIFGALVHNSVLHVLLHQALIFFFVFSHPNSMMIWIPDATLLYLFDWCSWSMSLIAPLLWLDIIYFTLSLPIWSSVRFWFPK